MTPAERNAVLEEAAPEDCIECAGNGEIVTDWDVYLHPPEGAEGDAGTAECPTCDGTGKAHPALKEPTT